MEAQEDRLDLGTAERNALRDRLLSCNAPHLAEAYEGAVRLLAQPDFPARRNLLSHLVRDIANGLPEVVTGDKILRFDTTKALDELATAWHRDMPEPSPFVVTDESPSPTVSVSSALVTQVSSLVRDHERVALKRRDQFALLMDALRPGSQALRPALEPVIREWVDEVRWFQGHAHVPRKPTTPPDNAELERRFRHFEDGLRGILAGHFEVTKEIDAILDASPPGDATLQRLMPLLGGAEQLRHFFNRIDDPAWLEPLERQGFLAVPEPIRDESRGTTAHWWWPAGPYLIRMAAVPEAQEAVARIASKIETANVTIHDDLAAIALASPPRLAARLVKPLVRALRSESAMELFTKTIGELTERLALSGEHAAAKELLKGLVAVIPDSTTKIHESWPATPRTRVDHHSLSRIFERHLPGIVSGLGLDALRVLGHALSDALRLSDRGDPRESIDDHSSIWRPALERHADGDARDVLVTAVLHATEQLTTTNAPAAIAYLRQRQWLVFQRIGMHVLARSAAPPQELVAAFALDRRLFDGSALCEEYGALLQRAFGALAESQQREWLGWVDAGRPEPEIRTFLERWSGKAATSQAVADTQRRWQWYRLGLIRDFLPPEWKERYALLAQEFGHPTPGHAYHIRARTGAFKWEAPKTRDQLRGMTIDEQLAFIKAWSPPRDRPFEAPVALADELAAVVAEAPPLYVPHIPALEELPPTYARAIVRGLMRAMDDGRAFDWSPFLRLAAHLVAQPVEEPERKHDLRQDPGWGWTRNAVIDLLKDALSREPSPLPLETRGAVWSLLRTLCSDPSPQRRGDALEASVRYAQWVRVAGGKPWTGDGALDDVPELRTVIDAALDLNAASAPRLHEAIGHQLPWLIYMDEAWVRGRLAWIFPTEPEHVGLWQAAWNAYLHAGVPKLTDRVFTALIDVYATAIERLQPAADEAAASLTGAEDALVGHLATFYGRGTLDTLGATSLLDRFFERARPGLRRHMLWYVGDSLDREAEGLPSDVVRRFQRLWQQRRDAAKTSADVRADLPAFGMWVGCTAFDPDWRLKQLEAVLRQTGTIDYAHRVAAELARMAERRSAAVMRCCALAIKGLRGQQAAYAWTDEGHVKTILAAALQSDDATTQTEAIETFHRLGSLGFRAHELLPFSDNLDDPATIAYFTWDHPMTVAEIRKRLTDASEPERNRMLGQILREAKDTDVWKFTTPQEVVQRWPQIERHLGRRRAFWEWLLQTWKEQGLLAS